MTYWVCYKRIDGKVQYFTGTNSKGEHEHSINKDEAFKFKTLEPAFILFNKGYSIKREYI